MSARARAEAPAKLNLHLEVGPERSDGYHGILSVFHAVDLHDGLEFELLPAGSDCPVDIEPYQGFPPEDNLVTKAARAFMRHSGLRFGLRVRLEKSIPPGAGMGGGSSDAAATLRALDALLETGFSPDVLRSIGASLGSDVPFFLGGDGEDRSAAALVKGRGEILESLHPRDDLWALLVNPGFPISTVEAFRALDRSRECRSTASPSNGEAAPRREMPDEAAIRSALAGDPASWPFGNSFTEPMAALHPELGEALAAIRATGAGFAEMSGSGSTLFGLYAEERDARRARAMIAASGLDCRVGILLARFPDVI